MVTNPKYGLVSPRFHLVFDNNPKIVPHLWAGTVPDNWSQLADSSKVNILEGFYDVTKIWFNGKVDPSAEPQSSDNHQKSSSAASQPNVVPTSSGGSSYPISSDNILVSGFYPSGNPQQMYGSEPKLEVTRNGGMISSNVLPVNGQLETCSDDLPNNGFSYSETNLDTPSLPPGLEETDHNDFRHVDFDENSNMPPIIDLATAG